MDGGTTEGGREGEGQTEREGLRHVIFRLSDKRILSKLPIDLQFYFSALSLS